MVINMDLGEKSYPIIVEKGSLNKADSYFNLDRKVLIVTDSGVPAEYSDIVAAKCKNAFRFVFAEGEESKTFETFSAILAALTENGFTRRDCVVAVGGGVAGDISGFAAACYMRGIDFYNVPTTLLSQVDSSIGGKTAIDFLGYKNIVGAFHQPKAVLIDINVLYSLDKRQISNGLAEVIKMAATSDENLFRLLENSDFKQTAEEVIVKSLNIKKNVVEQDEKETGLRRVLNFGHTIAHAVESTQIGNLYHGECVAIGMLPMCSGTVRERISDLLKKYNLPTEIRGDIDTVCEALIHDKKSVENGVVTGYVDKIGSFEFREMSYAELQEAVKEVFSK